MFSDASATAIRGPSDDEELLSKPRSADDRTTQFLGEFTKEDITPCALLTEEIHRSVAQAQADPEWPQWESALNNELASLKSTGTIENVDSLPDGATPIPLMPLFSKKFDASAGYIKHKARVVAKGFRQRFGIDYKDTFAPTPRDSSWRMVLHLAATHDLSITQYDVKTAFLHADLNEALYGVLDGRYVKICKALYGLKQAPRQWFEHLAGLLKRAGLVPTVGDPCLYHLPGHRVYLLCYVDDIIIAADSHTEATKVIAHLSKDITITGGEKVSSFIGLRIQQQDGVITVDQTGYIQELAAKFPEIPRDAVIRTPMASQAQFQKAALGHQEDASLRQKYRSLLGGICPATDHVRSNENAARHCVCNKQSRHSARLPNTKPLEPTHQDIQIPLPDKRQEAQACKRPRKKNGVERGKRRGLGN